MTFLRPFFVITTTVLMAGCGPAPFDRAAEQQKLLQRDAEWAEVASAGPVRSAAVRRNREAARARATQLAILRLT